MPKFYGRSVLNFFSIPIVAMHEVLTIQGSFKLVYSREESLRKIFYQCCFMQWLFVHCVKRSDGRWTQTWYADNSTFAAKLPEVFE